MGPRPDRPAPPPPTRCGGCRPPITSRAKTIDVVDVAATGPDSPVPPGLSHLPGPGQFYASPALTRLLRSTPAAELGRPLPGYADRHHRTRRPARAQLADHRHRSHPRRAVSPAGGERGRQDQHQHDSYLRSQRLGQQQAAGHPGRRRAGAAVSRAHLHRHRHPPVRGPARAAVRRPAPGRRHPPAGLGDLRGRIVGRRPRRGGRRLRRVLPAPPRADRRGLHR